MKIEVSINPDLVDKNATNDTKLFAEGWENVDLSVAELAELIRDGVAYCAQLKNGRRNRRNFLRCNVLSVDVRAIDSNGRVVDMI